jgi:F-type H+-transporting ATPase subunit epsilon
MSLSFQLVSASGTKFDGEAHEVLVPTKDGEIAVLQDHMPLLSAGQPGVIRIRKKAGDTETENFAVYGGVLQVDGKSARFITDDVTTEEEVSEQEANEALERAQKMIEEAGTSHELHEAKNVLHHHTARLHLAQLKRRHHR